MKELGLQWQIEKNISFEQNVRMAIARHFVKYAADATVANANPEDLQLPVMVDGVQVTPQISCPKGCLFVGRKI